MAISLRFRTRAHKARACRTRVAHGAACKPGRNPAPRRAVLRANRTRPLGTTFAQSRRADPRSATQDAPGSPATRTHPGGLSMRKVAAFACVFVFASVALARAAADHPHAHAAQDTRVDAHLRAILERAEDDEAAGIAEAPAKAPLALDYSRALPGSPIDLMIEGPVERAALAALGVEVNTQAGGVTTARAPLGLLPRLLTVPGITRVAASAPVFPMLDVSAHEIGA